MRLIYQQVIDLEGEILAINPDKSHVVKDFWEREAIPFIGLIDPRGKVLTKYQQEVNILKLGRLPSAVLVDKHGEIRHVHRGNSMADTLQGDNLIELLEMLR